MAFCEKCGAQMNEGARFCQVCGHNADTDGQAQEQQYAQQPPPYQQPVTPGAPQQTEINDAQENKTMSILAYILFFIPLLTGAHKTSPFAKFHTNQGTVLFISALTWGIVYGILSSILIFIPVIGWLIMLLLGLTGFVFLAFCIIGIINAVNGVMKPLPIIGKFVIIK